MSARTRLAAGMVGLVLMGGVVGCSSHATAAAAGAGAAYYLTSRGAEGLAEGSMDEVTNRARSAMERLGITQETPGVSEGSDNERELHGKHEDKDVTIELERRDDNRVLVQAIVKKNAATWDKDFARRIVQEVVEYTSPTTTPVEGGVDTN